MSQQLQTALEQAKEKLKEQHELLDRLCQPSLQIGRIVEVTKDRIKAITGSGFVDLLRPGFQVKTGDEISVSPETGQIVRRTEFKQTGVISSVRRVISGNLCEIDASGNSKLVYTPDVEVEVGDEVLVDDSFSVVIQKISTTEDQQFAFTEDSGITWSDIGGLDEAKKLLKETIELPYSYPNLFKWYNKRPIKGIELHGPPGCGKTMLIKALTSSLSDNRDKRAGFFYIKGPEILDPFVGAAEATIRRLFSKGRLHHRKSGSPSIIFIDEADAILGKRGTGISTDVEKTIVPAFLAEMDGLNESGTIVILATNRADRLDPAVVRPGRIDRRIYVRRPNEKEAANIFNLYLKKTPIKGKTKSTSISRLCAKDLFSNDKILYRISFADNTVANFTLGHLASGAMIASVVDQAVSECLHSDIRSGRVQTGQGITLKFLEKAIHQSFMEMFDVNHDDDLETFIRNSAAANGEHKKVVNIEKTRRSHETKAASSSSSW